MAAVDDDRIIVRSHDFHAHTALFQNKTAIFQLFRRQSSAKSDHGILHHHMHELIFLPFMQLNGYIGILFLKRQNGLAQNKVDHETGASYPYGQSGGTVVIHELRPSGADVHDALNVIKYGFPLRGKTDAGLRAAEYGKTKTLLQRVHGSKQGLLSDIELQGGLVDGTAASDFQKIPELPYCHT